MSDIFISYAREDLDRVALLAQALAKQGWSVFWDRTTPTGKTWRDFIGGKLDAARCVVVVWSQYSVKSGFVHEEADVGRERSILAPILIDHVRPPLGFGGIQAADLSQWDGTSTASILEQLFADISQLPGLEHKQEEEHRNLKQRAAKGEEKRRAAEEQVMKSAAEEAQRLAEAKDRLKIDEENQRKVAGEQAKKAAEEEAQRRARANAHARSEAETRTMSAAVQPWKYWAVVGAVAGAVLVVFFAVMEHKPPSTSTPPVVSKPAPSAATQAEATPPPEFRANVSMEAAREASPPLGIRAGTRFRDCEQDVCPWLVMVPNGAFLMRPEGAGQAAASKGHLVTIAYQFAVMETEVTRRQFGEFVKETGYLSTAEECGYFKDWRWPGFKQANDHPVVCVTWPDAQAYAKWLSSKTGRLYRLLSASEWEYVARAGTTSRWFFGDSADNICAYDNVGNQDTIEGNKIFIDGSGWAGYATCSDGYLYTAPIKKFKPNLFGLYDVNGNVREWVLDCVYNQKSTQFPTDGSAWDANCDVSARVARGGSWALRPYAYLWEGGALNSDINRNDFDLGFRLARIVTADSNK